MEFIQIPCVGDIIAFSDNWRSHVKVYSNMNNGVSPYGLVTNVDTYQSLLTKNYNISPTRTHLYGSLAYPITMDMHKGEYSKVFTVKWAIESREFQRNYAYINEEWFYNKTFAIISAVKRHEATYREVQ